MVETHFREAAVECRFQGESFSFASTAGFIVGCSLIIREGGGQFISLSVIDGGRLDSEYLALFIYYKSDFYKVLWRSLLINQLPDSMRFLLYLSLAVGGCFGGRGALPWSIS